MVGIALIRAFKSLYRGSSACVKINRKYIDWFDIRRGVRLRCVASSLLLNLYMDSFLYNLKEYECGPRMDELSLKCLLYAGDQLILTSSACELQETIVRSMNYNISSGCRKLDKNKSNSLNYSSVPTLHNHYIGEEIYTSRLTILQSNITLRNENVPVHLDVHMA
ncbi:hypothetical protein EVAR_57779_1 [Eumeta japonica]|uniref:Uncharacterized protein n=1 Tax=Eumeta variegata TaxID=151549 RepID=A0A4C1Y459_EUMVA|nr:hypothetical protein EVAR_57779_1 [Eumeta japonica]